MIVEDNQEAFRNGVKVNNLHIAIQQGLSVDLIPRLVEQVIVDAMWKKHFFEKTGETFRFDSFQAFIETHAPNGLGIEMKVLVKLCKDEPRIIEMIDAAVAETKSTIKAHDSRGLRQTTSSQQYALRRLKAFAEQDKSVADLHQAVLNKKMTVNAALVAAGLRKPRFSISTNLDRASEALRKHYSEEERKKLVELLQSE